MQDVVSVCSRITFGNSTEVFILPLPLLINPQDIQDEILGVYRVSIGMFYESASEATDEYQRLFNKLDTLMPFVENMHIKVMDDKLTFKLAYVMRRKKPFGIFYDIEAIKEDLEYRKEI